MATNEELYTDWHEHALQDARGERIGAAITFLMSAVLIGGAFILEHTHEPGAALCGVLGGMTLLYGIGELEIAHEIRVNADEQFAARMDQITE